MNRAEDRLYQDILETLLDRQRCEVTFPDFDINAVNKVTLGALARIRDLVESPHLTCEECCRLIEDIIYTLRDQGIFTENLWDYL